MSERQTRSGTARSADDRATDHEAIARLADEVLPALVARLGASGLVELEVGEDGWRLRIRRLAGERRAPTGGRGTPGRGREDGRPGGETGRELGRAVEPTHRRSETPGAHSGAPAADPQRAAADSEDLPPLTAVPIESAATDDLGPLVATSPAVGIFRARGELRTGTRVRAGDRIATVDMLGVPQEVTAPADGVVATALVEDGDAVEFGQALVVLEPVAAGKGT